MKRILCVGELLIDFFGTKEDTPLHHQKHFERHTGGAPANVAAVAAALGASSSLLSAVGKDGFGTFLKETVSSYGVHTEGVIAVDACTTMAFVSVGAQGQRDFVFNRGADAKLAYTDFVSAFAHQHHLIHLGAATAFLGDDLETTYHKVFEEALRAEKFIAFDPNYRSGFWEGNEEAFRGKCMPFIAAADLVKVSDEELWLLTKSQDLSLAVDKLTKQMRGLLCVTLGSKGAYVVGENWRMLVAAPQVAVVDTTGAGDAFVGAMLQQLANLETPKSALKDQRLMHDIVAKANQVAAKVCTAYGALTALNH